MRKCSSTSSNATSVQSRMEYVSQNKLDHFWSFSLWFFIHISKKLQEHKATVRTEDFLQDNLAVVVMEYTRWSIHLLILRYISDYTSNIIWNSYWKSIPKKAKWQHNFERDTCSQTKTKGVGRSGTGWDVKHMFYRAWQLPTTEVRVSHSSSTWKLWHYLKRRKKCISLRALILGTMLQHSTSLTTFGSI